MTSHAVAQCLLGTPTRPLHSRVSSCSRLRRTQRQLRRAPARVSSSPRAEGGGFGAGVATRDSAASNPLDAHVPIDRFYDGLRQLHASPDIYLVDDFLTGKGAGAEQSLRK